MGVLQPVTNFKDYVSQNPPWVTFFLCLLTLAFSFIYLSSYIYTHTLPNPDTTKDWNHLLFSLSQFQLCVKANASSSVLPSPSPLMDRNTTLNSTKTSPFTSLRLKVPVTVAANVESDSVKDLCLHTTITAKQLHFKGNETVNITLEFFSGNSTFTCLTISAPTHLLPMNLLPPECPASEEKMSPIHVEAGEQPPAATQTCYSLHSSHDPKLTDMLTQEDQSLSVRHLLEVSVCLLGVCLMLCLSASLTHSLKRHQHGNGLDPQNEPLIDT